MSHVHRSRLLNLIFTLGLSFLFCTPSLPENTTLLSIGPRFGFTGKAPLLGREQKHTF